MKIFMIFAVIAILPNIASSSINNRLSPLSQITSVIVYEDRAMVTRTAHLTLETEEYKVAIVDLPEGIMDASVRASGRGLAMVKITGLEIEKIFLEKSGIAKVRDLEEQIQKLEDDKKGIQDQIAARKIQQKFLNSLQVLSSEQISEELSTKRPNVEEYQQVLSFLFSGLANVNLEIQKLEMNKRELQEKLNVLQKELQQVRSLRARMRKSAIVSLQADRSGAFDLEVSYVVRGAGWRPSYDARVIGNPNKVELRYYGEVWQRTGEDWPEARVTLSTARPAVGGRAPELITWALNYIPQWYGQENEENRRIMLRGALKDKPAAKPSPKKLEEDAVARLETAQVRSAGTSVLFEIDERKEVSSDGSPQKFTIAIDQFKPKMQYNAVPKLTPYAYLHSKVKNEAEYPLLAGPVNIFMGPDFIGKASIDNVAPTEEFPLYLGVDEGIKIKRDLIKKEKSKVGFLTKKEKIHYTYKTTITSFKKNKVKLSILDQVPVSQNKEIVITDVKITPTPKENKTDQGELQWEFEISPKEELEIILEYSVEYPNGKEIAGLF
jgi:uncharacterized protein (TIGR02231 family)